MYYIDNNGNTDPYLNLALEEYVIKQLDRNSDYLLLYVNKSSLIIGKHQNVVEEVNQLKAGELGIPIIRRLSGGGTVYHDSGNLNISVITNQTLKNFNKYLNFLKPVLEVLKDLNLEASLNERNNISINNKKISGNAQFTSRNRLLSHGTLLVDSDLNMIDQLIKPKNLKLYHSKSTKSIRSQITNISNQLCKSISAKEIRQKILQKIYRDGPDELILKKRDWKEIEKLVKTKYKTWQWNYGLSPECQICKEINTNIGIIKLEIHITDGIIKSFAFENENLHTEEKNIICQLFINQRYDYVTIKRIQKKVEEEVSLSSVKELPWMEILLN